MPTRPRDVYIISDLHIGGAWPSPTDARGFRMMTRPDALAAFIEALARRSSEGERGTELVINGDFVDFLAEENEGDGTRWLPFRADPIVAADTLRQITARPADSPVFRALGELVRSGHRLTVLLGNHDIELSLPSVRAALDEAMGTDGGWRFHYDGEAYPIAPEVLIEHGNRYDPANVVDHDGLRRLRSLISRGQTDELARARFEPPTGSRLVAEIMNPIKADFGFIDLLKPESEPLFALLLALDPSTRKVLGRLSRQLLDMTDHLMAKSALPSYAGDIAAGDELVGDEAALERVLKRALGADAATALAQAAGAPGALNPYAADIGAGDWIISKLGLLRLLVHGDLASVEERVPMVQQALRALRGDQTFDDKTETGRRYREAAESLSVDGEGRLRHRLVIFGHTHHARDVQLDTGARYLNSGTWANLMRFPPALLHEDPRKATEALVQFLSDLEANRIASYIEFRPTYLHLVLDGAGRLADAGLRDYDWKAGRLD